MSGKINRKKMLTQDELTAPFTGANGDRFPVILSVQELAGLLGLSPKTLYEWIAKKRLDGAFRKRGKHILFWRNKVLDLLFNGKEWE